MLLWTYQGVGHSLTDGHIDVSQSPHLASVRGHLDAIKELGNWIAQPSGQFIWRLTRDTEWKETAVPRIKYTLEAASSDFLAVLDGPVWERILGTTSVPDSCCERWDSEWDCQSSYRDFIEMKEREYHALQPPHGSWWESLIIDDPTAESTVLLKHPIPAHWIISYEPHQRLR